MAKVTFLQKQKEELLGPMYLSAMLKAGGHQCDILVEPFENDCIVQKALSQNPPPDLIAFSCLSTDYYWALRKAAVIKNRSEIRVLLGGTQITLNPEIVINNPQIDLICLGEGEFPILELAEALDQGEDFSTIPNLWVKTNNSVRRNELRNLVDRLDLLPFPDRRLYRKYRFFERYARRPLQIGRGCPFNCSYCHNEAKKILFAGKGRYVRSRSVENVLAEIDHLQEECSPHVLHFVDDSFGANQEWLTAFLPQLADRVPSRPVLYANTRADLVNDALCRALSDYGRDRIRLRFAVECADEAFRQRILNKKIRDSDLLQAADLLHRYRIPFVTYNMVGLPGETPEMALNTLELNLRLKPTSAICFVFQPFAGTRLAEYAVENEYVSREAIERNGEDDFTAFFHSRSILRQDGIRQIENIHRVFGFVVWFPFLFRVIKTLTKYEAFAIPFDYAYRVFSRIFRLKRKLNDKF